MFFWIADLALGTSRREAEPGKPEPEPRRKPERRSRRGPWTRVKEWVVAWFRWRQGLSDLERLNDRLLADAGLTREDIADMRSGIYKPYQKEPAEPLAGRKSRRWANERKEEPEEKRWSEAA